MPAKKLRCCRDCSWPHKCVSNLAPDSSGPFCAARRARSRRPLRRSECPMWRTLYEGLHKRSGVNRRQWPAFFWLQTMLNAWTNYDKLKNLTRSCHRDPSRNSAIGGSHLLSVCSKGLLRANHAPASSRLAADSPLATRFANFWLSTQETGFVHGFLQRWERMGKKTRPLSIFFFCGNSLWELKASANDILKFDLDDLRGLWQGKANCRLEAMLWPEECDTKWQW